jgi:hypothetical protein
LTLILSPFSILDIGPILILLEAHPETGSISKLLEPGHTLPNSKPECKIETDPFIGGEGGRGQCLAENIEIYYKNEAEFSKKSKAKSK